MIGAGIAVAFVILIILVLVVIAFGVRIVRPFEKGVVETLGKYTRTADSGLRWIVPVLQHISKVDMRERVIDVPPQSVITKDNVVVAVDAVIYFEATDPVKLQYNVSDFTLAVTKLAQTNLRNVVGDLALDEALISRDHINRQLRQILDGATDKWGTRVVRVEVQRFDPPADVTEAMHRQMKAERVRRAAVTEAEGDKAAAILRSEGQKQSQILDAEGEAAAIRSVADAERYKLEAIAQGEGASIERIFAAIHNGDPTPDLIAIQYLETLKSVADGQATKIFLPLDNSGLANAVASLSEIARTNEPDNRKW